jgi:hypothetical protein
MGRSFDLPATSSPSSARSCRLPSGCPISVSRPEEFHLQYFQHRPHSRKSQV